mgnify:CR=1 FL=1
MTTATAGMLAGVLLGVAAAAGGFTGFLLALVLDIAIRLLERALTPWRRAGEGSAA